MNARPLAGPTSLGLVLLLPTAAAGGTPFLVEDVSLCHISLLEVCTVGDTLQEIVRTCSNAANQNEAYAVRERFEGVEYDVAILEGLVTGDLRVSWTNKQTATRTVPRSAH